MNRELAFRERLAEAIRLSGLQKQEIASTLEIRRSTISSWLSTGESGTLPRTDQLLRLVGILGISSHWLLTGEGPIVPDLVRDRRMIAMHGVLSATPEQLAELIELIEPSAAVSDNDNGATDPAASREELEAALQRITEEHDRLRAQVSGGPELPDPDVSPIQSAPGWRDEDYETVRRYESEDVALAAGTGTFADQEPVAGEVKFRTSWLREHHLRANDLFLVDVLGDSMEPTICDGDSALVDETHRSPRSGKIYALRTGDGPLVKRLRKRDHRWWADSDNDKYEPQPLDDVARILGRVVWWAHTD